MDSPVAQPDPNDDRKDDAAARHEAAVALMAERRRRRWRRSLIGTGVLALVFAILGGVVAALFWAAGTVGGTAWILARLSAAGVGVQVVEPVGILIGDLKARQVIVTAGHTRIVIDKPVWMGATVNYTPVPDTWARISLKSLYAERVTITNDSSQPSDGKPITLPRRMRLPIELAIDEVRVSETTVPGLPSERPLRDLKTRLHLGADNGRQHRLDDLSLTLEPLRISGHLRIGADAPLPLDVDLLAVQASAAAGNDAAAGLPNWAKALRADWQAQLKASGPLARFDAQAQLRAQNQSLDATALVAPADAWPLPRLQATTQGLDLSALLAHAPLTSLSGTVRISPAEGQPAGHLVLDADLKNAKPGRWDAKQLPARQFTFAARWQPGQAQTLDLDRLDLQLADERREAGNLKGTARWNAGEFALDAQLDRLLPASLDARLAAMSLSGPVKLSGKVPPAAAAASQALPDFTALADLKGQLVSPAQPVQLKLDASGADQRIELRELRASAGEARAVLSGTAERVAQSWDLKLKSSLVNFDPRPWYPAGPGGGWQNGDHRFNLDGHAALNLSDSLRATGPDDRRLAVERLTGLRGEAQVKITDSQIGGVSLAGDASWTHARGPDPMQARVSLDLGGNQLQLDGQLMPDAVGASDRWSAQARAPSLARLTPLLQLLVPAGQTAMVSNLGGALTAEAQLHGRWPAITTQGQARLEGVRSGAWSVGQGETTWQAGTAADAPLDVQINIGQAAWAERQLASTLLQLKGTPAQHDFSLRTELRAAPPVWMESLQGGARPASIATSASAPSPAASAAAPTQGATPAAPVRTQIQASARGSLSGGFLGTQPSRIPQATPPWAWKGVVQRLEASTTQAGAAPLLVTRDIGLEITGGEAMRANITEGRADILDAGLRWNRIDWVSGQGVQTQQLDMQADLEPLAVAPLLRRVQPNFGWGGDLQIAGKVVIRQTDAFRADIVLERTRGDLTVTDEAGTQPLGLSDLRVGLNAEDGVWSFTAGLAGQQLGVLGGALVVRTSPQLAWPAADAPVQGVVEAQVANLGTWGAWVPAGWRLDGKLNVSASFGGRFSAPEYTGQVIGAGIGVRNVLEGVNITDGEVDIALRGDTARINKFTARGGSGSVKIEGDAKLDENWRSRLTITADKFQALGRVDLRVVTSGQAQVDISGENVKTEGRFVVDEALIDFTRLSSPSLGDDVIVTGRANENGDTPPASTPTAPANNNRVTLNLVVNLGDNTRMRGLGIDTRLRGELRVARPGGKWGLAGTVNAVDGTFANYGQKLVIDRGVITFNGAPSDMRLDIEATRPNLDLDVRVGVQVIGPLQNLRVRLFSEPDMSNNEKLSWLLLGRASEGLGKADNALVQRAAFALLAGDGDGGPGAITKAFGIDDVGLSQKESGDSRETVVSVGKQLSKRVYVAYEQNLATSSGSVQVTYRIAQRFVMRLQSGLDRSIDLIGTWRWE